MNTKGLNVRDLINAGLFSVLLVLVTFIFGMLGLFPFLMPFIPFIIGIFTGSVYMLYTTRIKKAGMLFIQQIVMALAFLISGHTIYMLITSVIGGLLAEIVLKMGDYKSVKYSRLAVVTLALSSVGNWIPIFFFREDYLQHIVDAGYGEDYARKFDRALPNWSLIPVIILGCIGMYIGCTIGIKILKKHFVKAGMVEDV